MPRSSVTLRRRKRASQSAQAALVAYKDLIVGKVKAFFEGHLREGAAPVDFGELWDQIGHGIEMVNLMVTEAEQEHHEKLSVVRKLRKLLAKATTSAYKQLVSLRRSLEGGYGTDADERVGYAGSVPDETLAVEQLGQIVLRHLANFDALQLEPLEDGSGDLDVDKELGKLETRVKALGTLKTQLDEARREAEQAQLRKRDAKEFHDRVYPNLARIGEAFCRLVGEDERADRLRPTIRRYKRKENNEEGEAAKPEETSETAETG